MLNTEADMPPTTSGFKARSAAILHDARGLRPGRHHQHRRARHFHRKAPAAEDHAVQERIVRGQRRGAQIRSGLGREGEAARAERGTHGHRSGRHRAARRRADRLFHDLWANDDDAQYKTAQSVLEGSFEWFEHDVLDPAGDGPMIPEAVKDEPAKDQFKDGTAERQAEAVQ